jgi:hypothetical protein
LEKNKTGRSIMSLAQDLIAKKCGEASDNMTLQQYLDMYKQPLTDQAMEAILKLTEVVESKKKKKKLLKEKMSKKEVKEKKARQVKKKEALESKKKAMEIKKKEAQERKGKKTKVAPAGAAA